MSNGFYRYFRGKSAMLIRAERTNEGFYRVDDVIDWFLARSSMSPKKLQKLLYYAYSWTLTLTNNNLENLENRLFSDRFEAWVHGPVIPHIYRRYKHLRFSDIPINQENIIFFDEDIEDILEQVQEVYGVYNGNELESITHQELPWINAREGLSPIAPSQNVISDVDIFTFYLNEMTEAYE